MMILFRLFCLLMKQCNLVKWASWPLTTAESLTERLTDWAGLASYMQQHAGGCTLPHNWVNGLQA